MLRAVVSLAGLVCFALVLAEAIALGFLGARGQLTAESIAMIGDALGGRGPKTPEVVAQSAAVPRPSADKVEIARTLHTLELNARADDLQLLKDLLTAEAERLKADRTAYERARAEFEASLAEIRARSTDDATEQTRLVVKAMSPRDALAYLLPLPEPDAIRIVKGLPERTTAKILQEFAGGTDEERQRGRVLFEALSAGKPETDIADAARAALPEPPAGDADG